MAAPMRVPAGFSNRTVAQLMGSYPLLDPSKIFTEFNDFVQYVAADWTVTNTTSHATVALAAGAGGILSITGGASSVTNDIGAVIKNPLDFKFASTGQVWFEAAIQATTALNDQLQIGITAANSALTPTDGIYFNKAAGSAAIDFVVRKSSASTSQAAIGTLVNATQIRLGFYYNGKDAIDVYVDNVKVYSQTVLTNLPAAVALAPSFGIKAAATAPTTGDLLVDFIHAAQTR